MNQPLKKLLFPFITLSAAAISGCAPLVVAGAGGATVGVTSGSNSVPVETQVSDVQIKMKAIDFLKDYPDLKYNSNVEIIVFDQIVLLLGQVPKAEIKTDLAKRVANINGVKVVYDQLIVGPRVSVGTYAADSFITTGVISSLIAHGINSLKYKVVTESGIVYMMGAVTAEEAKEASQVASRVSGVNKVIEAYSIIPSQINSEDSDQLSNHQITDSNEHNEQHQDTSAIGPTGPV
ncbi:BON domain-containing protein [Thiotrichales bacterium 19S9-12]|nr:BON domain-containing protein [Thiotrichales bacterium 19S9-11]MCF6812298.1 BON domain-containing protein [Thiotrichales bacterium 19S9-12]